MRIGGDVNQAVYREQSHRRPLRIVAAENQTTDGVPLFRIPEQDLPGNALSLCPAPLPASCHTPRDHAIKRQRLCVVGMLLGKPAHRLRIGELALGHGSAVPIAGLHRGQVGLLARRWGLCGPSVRSRPEAIENLSRVVVVLLSARVPGPFRMLGHGFAPVGHGEVGIDRLCLSKKNGRIVVAQGMESGHTLLEVPLCFR